MSAAPQGPRGPDQDQVDADVRQALEEDLGSGDLTADLLAPDAILSTRVVCREAAVFCGRAWFEAAFRQLDPGLSIEWFAGDGDALEPDQVLCHVGGAAAPLLSGERTALNFIQTLSGTATVTRRYVDRLAGTKTRLLDTRKTLPGLRQAQKYAVLCGGGENHRMGLFDAILIKENHIRAAGGIPQAVETARRMHPGKLVEVEVENLDELDQAIGAEAHRVLLDNFTLPELRAAVERTASRAELEASGNVTLETLRDIAETGVDFISTGAITKHLHAVDFSLRFRD